jgi:beta-glucosidase
MCSYNKIYGSWACENNSTLQRDLKRVMQFPGFVMSDWGATHSTSIEAGLDVEMPGADFMGAKLLAAVQAQQIDEAYVDDSGVFLTACSFVFVLITSPTAVYRILLQMFTMGLFDHPNFNSRASNVTSVEHNDLARKLSAASTVLLKNSHVQSTSGRKAPALPLQKQGQKIAFIGRASDNCFTHSGGSGSVEPSRVVTPLQGALHKVSSGSSITYNDGKDIGAAAAAAKAADVAVVFAGTTSSEGYDRANLNLDDNLDALIAAVAAAQPNTVAVLSVPGAIVMPWMQVR